ncbi:MAG: type III secretion protein [Deltaproteobacteria bacterium]|nr:MAG: type III secretion protein [Deltaproteobacteria bacterium]
MTVAIVAAFVAAVARCAAFLHAAPVIGESFIPANIRLTVAAAMAAAITPLRGPLDPALLPVAIPSEIVVGALAGLAARVVVAGAESAGQIIGLQIGLGFAASYDPALGETALAARRVAWCLAALAFVIAGGVEAAVPVLVGDAPAAVALAAGVRGLIDLGAGMFVAAVRLAAPAILAGLIANLVMALASRAAPALNVFSVMLAGVLVVGGAVLIATAPAFIRDVAGIGRRAADAVSGVLP